MKKRISILLAVLMMFSLVACGGGSGGGSGSGSGGGGGDAIRWTMATIYQEPIGGNLTHMSLGASMQRFIADVYEMSGGRLVIEGFYNAVLGSSNDTFQQMTRGEIDVFFGQPMSAIDTRFGAWGIPYLFRDYDEILEIATNPDGEFFALSSEWIADHNGTLLAKGITNMRGIFNASHPVITVDDVASLRLRTFEDPVVNTFWGGISLAVPMPITEVYTALQTNAIDGLEFSANSVINRRFYEVGTYFTDINWQWTSGANFIVNTDAFNALPADLQEIVTEAARQAAIFQGDLERADEEIAFDVLVANGGQIHFLTDAERQVWIDFAESISAQMRDAIGAEAYDQVRAIVANARG